MREIKFRAWVKKEKEMTKVLALETRDYATLNVLYNDNSKCTLGMFAVETMQYTGLKDKNGKEIYENDLISCNKYKNIVVFFENGCFKVKYSKNDTTNVTCTLDTFLEKYKCKISGNIYENKNSLEENR